MAPKRRLPISEPVQFGSGRATPSSTPSATPASPNTNFATIDPNLATAGAQNPNATTAELGAAASALDTSNPSGAVGYQPPAPPTAAQQAESTALQSASAQIDAFLQTVPGLAALDPNNELGKWMKGQTSSLYGSGITDSTAIANTLETTMNNPTGDPAAKAVFDQLFPGYNQKILNGTSNADGSYTGIAGYIAYASQINQFAQTARLPAGTVSAQTIGNMWAGNVSTAEVSERITSAYTVATNTPPAVQDYLATTYGLGPGDIAGYYLNPTNAVKDISAVNTGIAGIETGFGDLSKAQATSLSAFLAVPSGNGMSLVSSQQANQALTGGLGNGMTGAAQMAKAGFESALPGTASGNPGVVTQDQLLGGIQGDTGALAAIRRATETRGASSHGGGGPVSSSGGAEGIGFGSQQ